MGTWTSSGPVRRPASRTRAVSSAARSTRSVGTPKARPAAASPRAARRRRPARRRWLGPPRPSPRSVDGRHGDRRDACRASPGLVPGRAPGGGPWPRAGSGAGRGPWPCAGSGAGRGSLALCPVGRRAGTGPPRIRADGRGIMPSGPAWGSRGLRPHSARPDHGQRGEAADLRSSAASPGGPVEADAGPRHGHGPPFRPVIGRDGTPVRDGTGRPCGAPRARVGLVRARVGLARDGPRVRLAGCASPQQPP